jgi:hypothetical protein
MSLAAVNAAFFVGEGVLVWLEGEGVRARDLREWIVGRESAQKQGPFELDRRHTLLNYNSHHGVVARPSDVHVWLAGVVEQ